jgi:hypothetical protein
MENRGSAYLLFRRSVQDMAKGALVDTLSDLTDIACWGQSATSHPRKLYHPVLHGRGDKARLPPRVLN